MRIAVTSGGDHLEAPLSPVFGRCPAYLLVDTETMEYEIVSNPASGAMGGAGVQAAQFIVQKKVEAVITGNMGPNAYAVLEAANIPTYLAEAGTVQQAIDAFKTGELETVVKANVARHFGTGGGRGRGMGRGWRR
ncbi:MAG: NifB/NifX family molybdenum-iron cluster-binding protein [Chloroflexota bacterium]|nr:NifB/NifX family molybdenum-iron cluster-binding protein [Chloroflexota bacterium]